MNWGFSNDDDALDKNSGSCRSCSLLTSYHCNRCGDYYCSEKCQYDDWPNHRYICFPRPPLVRTRGGNVHENENEIFNVNPPSHSENYAIEMRAILATIMKKLQFIESNIKDTNMMMNGSMTNNLDEPRDFEGVHNGSQDSVTVQNNSSRDLDKSPTVVPSNFTNGPRISKTAQINGLHGTLNNFLSESQMENVILCTFRTTNRCAIRSTMPETEEALRAIIKYVDLYGRNAEPMKTLPDIGAYAITLKSNKNYTRVKVLNVQNDRKIRVLFCDYGNVVFRKLTDLREISDEIRELPEYVSTVQLHGVKMSKYSEKISEFLKSFERKEYKIKYINKVNENTFAELYDIESNELINGVVAKFCSENEESSKTGSVNQLSQLSSNSIDKQTTFESELSTDLEDGSIIEPTAMSALFQTHLLTENMINIKAIVVDAELIEFGYIACVQKTDMHHLAKVQQFLNTTDLGKEPYEPKLEEYCVAQFENQWYRGFVVNIFGGGTKFEISYIDFLNEATITSDCIRPYPKDLKVDCYTTLCKIHGLPGKLTSKQREFLKSEININDIISIDCVKSVIEKKVALIQCNEIINSMRAQNLI